MIDAKLDKLKQDLITNLPLYASNVAALDLIALVTNRVVQSGLNYKMQPFTPYSKKTVAAWRFWGKSRTQSAENKIRRLSRNKGRLSYIGFREMNNLSAARKNFEFSGEMWRKVGVVKTSSKGGKFSIRIGGTTTESQRKIDENSSREGISIIEPSKEERKIVADALKNYIIRQIKRYE